MSTRVRGAGMNLDRQVLLGIEELDQQRKSASGRERRPSHDLFAMSRQRLAQREAGTGSVGNAASTVLNRVGQIREFPGLAEWRNGSRRRVLSHFLQRMATPRAMLQERVEEQWSDRHGGDRRGTTLESDPHAGDRRFEDKLLTHDRLHLADEPAAIALHLDREHVQTITRNHHASE